jgi:3'-phosphoadenosine 5'-phosphosulfate sulfotransferase (PAPS reductase)/FAD synthetase
MVPDLRSYRWVVLHTSAGKDSQAMLDVVVERCDHAGVPRRRLVVVHADLGRVEWPGTRRLAEEQARCYGLDFVAVARPQGDLLDHIAARGMFPSPQVRWCTSDHKRGQALKVLTRLTAQALAEGCPPPVRVLSCLGRCARQDGVNDQRSR